MTQASRAALLAGLAAIVAGCIASLDGLAAAPATAPDAAPPGDGAFVGFAPSQADATDAGAWCPRPSDASFSLCSDFDEGSLSTGWEDPDIDLDAGTITLDDAASSSPPGSAAVLLDPGAYQCGYVRLLKTFSPTVTQAHFAFDVALEATRSLGIARLTKDGATSCNLILVVGGDNGGRIQEQTFSPQEADTQHGFTDLPSSTWIRLSLDVDYAAGRVKLSAGAAGVEPVGEPGQVLVDDELLPACRGAGKLSVSPGFDCFDEQTKASHMHLDNIVVEGR